MKRKYLNRSAHHPANNPSHPAHARYVAMEENNLEQAPVETKKPEKTTGNTKATKTGKASKGKTKTPKTNEAE